MRLCVRFAAFIALTLASAFAQTSGTGSLTGRVINQATGDYLRNAIVTVPGTNISATAEAGGYYRLNGVPAGTVKIAVSYTGLDSQEVSVQVAPGQTVTKDIALSSSTYTETLKLDQFIVATSREGNAKAIMDQRTSVNVKKVISSDAMGNVSEGNVGEFLKLMPGVSMDYVESDTRAMRVRGLNPKYATVLLDGMQPASAGSSNVGTGRAFEFEQLSISSIETVELTKAPTPDQPSSVAGTVNLRTKGAFDRKGRRLTYRAGLAANTYGSRSPNMNNNGKTQPLLNGSLEYSDVILDGKLGVIAGFDRSATLAVQKHIWNNAPTWNTNAADNDTEVPVINRWWFQDGPKPTYRANYNLRLDYRLNDALQVYGRWDYTDYDARFYNRTLNLFATTYAPGATFTDMTVTNGRIQTDSNQFMTKEGHTVALTGGAMYKKGNFSADLTTHYSRAINFYGNLQYGHFSDFASQITGISWRLTRPDRGSEDITFTQLSGPNWRDPASYSFVANSIGWHERNSQDQQWSTKLDFRHDLTLGSIPQVIRYGGLANLKALDVHRYGLLTMSATGPDGIAGNADDPKPVNYVDDRFSSDWGAGGNMNGWFALSPWKLYSRFVSNPGDFVQASAANNLQRVRNNWNFKEEIQALYVSDRLTLGKLSLSPGLRYETTDSSGKGVNTVTNLPITGGNSYNSLLRYVHGSYNFTRNLIARGSYHTAITRGDIQNLIPGISGVDFTNTVLTATNPDLKPERSQSWNGSLEYYFEPVGYVSASAFYTKVRDRQFTNRTQLGASGYEGDATYANWMLNSPVNISYATSYKGIELDYQQQLKFLPGVLSNLGIFANHTRVKYDDWAFNTGSPEVMTNAGVTFGFKGFFARVNYNHVGKLLQNAQRTYSAATNTWTVPVVPLLYQKDRPTMDINLEYRFSDRLTLFVDGRNVFNEPTFYNYFGREENFERILRTGTIWMFGVKGRF